MIKNLNYYFLLLSKVLSVFSLFILLVISLEYTFIYRLPTFIINYIPKSILNIPFGTQIILIILLSITILTAYYSKSKHPVIRGIFGLISTSGISLTLSLSKFFANNQEGAIILKFIKIIKKFPSEYKFSEFMLSFNKTLQEKVEVHKEILNFKQKILVYRSLKICL
jgi:hypothetical protein